MLALAMEALTYPKLILIPHATQVSFSIICVFKDEQDYLPDLLSSMTSLDYPISAYEVILVNDASTDQSVSIIKKFLSTTEINLRLVDRSTASASAKKDGITQALELCNSNLIITTDADCVLPQKWLRSYASMYAQFPESEFIAAPVSLIGNGSLLHQLQYSEFTALQIMTIGGFAINQPFMCNGANMSFKKSSFKRVGGYTGNSHIPSGDDVFLLEKISASNTENCKYMLNISATVQTSSTIKLTHYLRQRQRWASKGSKTKSSLNKLMSFQVLAMNLLLITAPALFFLQLIHLKWFLFIIIVKLLTDTLVLVIGKSILDFNDWRKYFLVQFLVYPFAVVFVAISTLFPQHWKDS